MVGNVEKSIIHSGITNLTRNGLPLRDIITERGRGIDNWNLGSKGVSERCVKDGSCYGAVAGRKAELCNVDARRRFRSHVGCLFSNNVLDMWVHVCIQSSFSNFLKEEVNEKRGPA